MKSILSAIIEHKRMEVLKRKGKKSLADLRSKAHYQRQALNPLEYFHPSRPSIIAEFKRKSPSKGIISDTADPLQVVKAYKEAGAVASSILTDRDFFGGSFKDLEGVRSLMDDFPLLRKDFIIDPYQVHEAKAYGADILLLIAAVLTPSEVKELSMLAASLGLSVLLELHEEKELECWNPDIKLIGVNNRNLKTFEVDLNHSMEFVEKLPKEVVKISESGLQNPEDIIRLFKAGFNGFLIGEQFMKSPDPAAALKSLLIELENDPTV